MSEGGRIDYDAGGALARLVNPVDQLKLGIGLAEFDVQSQLSGCASALGLYVGQRLVSVDFGFALAEQVQVGAVQNIDDRVHVVGVRIFVGRDYTTGQTGLVQTNAIAEGRQCRMNSAGRSQEAEYRILLEGLSTGS